MRRVRGRIIIRITWSRQGLRTIRDNILKEYLHLFRCGNDLAVSLQSERRWVKRNLQVCAETSLPYCNSLTNRLHCIRQSHLTTIGSGHFQEPRLSWFHLPEKYLYSPLRLKVTKHASTSQIALHINYCLTVIPSPSSRQQCPANSA